MWRNTLVDIILACGAISSLALTAALIKASRDFLMGKLFTPRVQVHVGASTATAGSTITAYPPPPTVEAIPVATPTPTKPPPPVLPRQDSADSVFPPMSPAVNPPSFFLECGNCHNQIKSAPLKMSTVGGRPESRYRCEHCGATVAVKA